VFWRRIAFISWLREAVVAASGFLRRFRKPLIVERAHHVQQVLSQVLLALAVITRSNSDISNARYNAFGHAKELSDFSGIYSVRPDRSIDRV